MTPLHLLLNTLRVKPDWWGRSSGERCLTDGERTAFALFLMEYLAPTFTRIEDAFILIFLLLL